MPGKVKVKIIAGRNLPVMDRSSDTTDAYVEIKLGGTTYKTDVCRKTLHPQWNSEWYRFELDDSDLQDEPLQMRLMDHDTYSANDAIGKVYLDLNPLLLPAAMMKYGLNTDSNNHDNTNYTVFSGWIPVYDTMHGIRGEVNVIVKVELFSDLNRYRQSSCGVHFFNSTTVPHGFYARTIYGFVEELVVNDDPEYQWIDKIRTPRASNEARQTLFFKLSGELRRKIGVKALELGANSVIGYRQCFDLEGESGIVARGIGTAAFLVKITHVSDVSICTEEYNTSTQSDAFHADHHRSESVGTKIPHSPPSRVPNIACRRSSDSDLSITPKGNSLTGSDRSGLLGHSVKPSVVYRSGAQQDTLDMLEYPFLTITKYPVGFILHLGGSISARSVKLLERISNFEEPEKRDTWWSELRMEIRSHARSLNCNAVLGYRETTSICEDLCVLSASGTAAMIHFPNYSVMVDYTNSSTNQDNISNDKKTSHKEIPSKNHVESIESEHFLRFPSSSCEICHLPYSINLPIESNNLKCALCRHGKVPEVLITTIELPEGIRTIGQGCLVQASVLRTLKDLKGGELNAKEISEGLPFLEYELHRILINKMKVKGMNAIFKLKVNISIGERVLLGTAVGTAVFLAALHAPNFLKLVSDRTVDSKRIISLQKRFNDTLQKNREIYLLKNTEEIQSNERVVVADNDVDEEVANLELSVGHKDFCLLEVDDPDDTEIVNLLAEGNPPHGIHVVNTEIVPGLEELEIVKNLQMFKQIYRSRIQLPFNLNQQFQKLLQCIYFKLRRMVPCAVCDLQLTVNVPEPDELQITVLGMVLGLGDSQRTKIKRKYVGVKNDELIFNIEGIDIPEYGILNPTSNIPFEKSSDQMMSKLPKGHELRCSTQRHIPYRERHGVDITPLSYIPGAKIERYLGNLNFFLIRETTSIREENGLSGFVHSFATEVLAVVRAHITALGGNGMVSYFMTECVLNYNLHKNQAQSLINVGGDVVHATYYIKE